MKDFLSLVLILLFYCNFVQAQDTLFIGAKVDFSSQEARQYFGKGYHGNYGREDIVFSENHKRIDFCYYQNNVRTCTGKGYWLENDSILKISNSNLWRVDERVECWKYKKLDENKYFISRGDSTFYEFGMAKSLIPLILDGKLTTTLANKKDTLWLIEINYLNPKLKFRIDYYQSKIDEKIFEYNEIDLKPSLLNGDSLPTIEIPYIKYCYCEPMYSITAMACIITSEGKIKNIEQAIGGASPKACPKTIMDIIIQIQNWGQITPAQRKNKKVAVRWFVKVNVQLNDINKHAAWEDNEQNRKRYIKSK